jgi:hypothetical protein
MPSQIDPTYTNKSLIALLIALNVIVVACDLSEANQVYHYAIFAFLASSAAGRFLYLIYSHPDALKPDVKRKALQYFFLGAAAILGGFAVCLQEQIDLYSMLTSLFEFLIQIWNVDK